MLYAIKKKPEERDWGRISSFMIKNMAEITRSREQTNSERASFYTKAHELYSQNSSLDKLIPAIKSYLFGHFKQFPKTTNPQSILESRFTPPAEAFSKGMRSCGTVTNIATEMLRELGFETKKVHGSVPQSPDHAWLSVRDPESGMWKQYDLMAPDCQVTPKHRVIAECDEWEDIRDMIEEAHQKGLPGQNK